jgi:SAM-dependent methyltransferase
MVVQPDSIARHSAQARYYKDRIPYHPELFAEVAWRLNLDQQSRLLDICCGTGEVAAGFAEHIGKVFAIDGSAEMLAIAQRNDKIVYAKCDVNADTYQAPESIDHFVIGRAVHWVSPQGLAALVSRNLAALGKIVVCSVQWQAKGDWRPVHRAVLRESNGEKTGGQHDYTGEETLASIGYRAVDGFAIAADHSLDVPGLARLTLAEAYGASLENLSTNRADFEVRLASAMSPYLRDGSLALEATSWARIYERRGG